MLTHLIFYLCTSSPLTEVKCKQVKTEFKSKEQCEARLDYYNSGAAGFPRQWTVSKPINGAFMREPAKCVTK